MRDGLKQIEHHCARLRTMMARACVWRIRFNDFSALAMPVGEQLVFFRLWSPSVITMRQCSGCFLFFKRKLQSTPKTVREVRPDDYTRVELITANLPTSPNFGFSRPQGRAQHRVPACIEQSIRCNFGPMLTSPSEHFSSKSLNFCDLDDVHRTMVKRRLHRTKSHTKTSSAASARSQDDTVNHVASVLHRGAVHGIILERSNSNGFFFKKNILAGVFYLGQFRLWPTSFFYLGQFVFGVGAQRRGGVEGWRPKGVGPKPEKVAAQRVATRRGGGHVRTGGVDDQWRPRGVGAQRGGGG